MRACGFLLWSEIQPIAGSVHHTSFFTIIFFPNGDEIECISAVYRVQVITFGLLTREMHVYQSIESKRTVHTGEVGQEEVIDTGRGYGAPIDGQCLHNLLGGGIKPIEGFAHQRLHYVISWKAIQHFAE